MSIREIISPNVTSIRALDIDPDTEFSCSAKLHPQGIIEIDTDLKLLPEVMTAFEVYDMEGALYPVSITGLTNVESGIGSHRFCAWDGEFAHLLTSVLDTMEVPELYQDKEGVLWDFKHVSKYLRFMRYSEGGEHFPHFDSDFIVRDTRPTSFGFEHAGPIRYATKYSLVMYFNNCESGEIAFIKGNTQKLIDNGTNDWDRQATDDEIFLKIKPKAGKIILFPHDVCHTVLPFTDPGAERYIVRGDLIFTEA